MALLTIVELILNLQVYYLTLRGYEHIYMEGCLELNEAT